MLMHACIWGLNNLFNMVMYACSWHYFNASPVFVLIWRQKYYPLYRCYMLLLTMTRYMLPDWLLNPGYILYFVSLYTAYTQHAIPISLHSHRALYSMKICWLKQNICFEFFQTYNSCWLKHIKTCTDCWLSITDDTLSLFECDYN